MPEGAAVGVLLCALGIGVAVETLIEAVCLRAGVALYNKLAGGASSTSSVPEPAFGKAMWIIFATSLAQMVVGLLTGFSTGVGAGPPGAGEKGVDVVALVSFLVGLLIMAAVLSAKLPTTFGNAILVTFCYILVVLLVVGVLVGIPVFVLGVALSGA